MTWSFAFSGFDTDLAGRRVGLLGWLSAGILHSRMASWEPLGVSTAPAPTCERGRWCCQTCFNPDLTQDSIYSSHTPQSVHPSHRAVLLQGQPWKWTKQDVLHWHISPTALNSPGNNPRNTCTRGNCRHRRAAPPCNLSTEAVSSRRQQQLLPDFTYSSLKPGTNCKGHGQGTQQILFAVSRCTLLQSFSHT